MTTLFIGDEVRHRGSSQIMRILSIYGDHATCEWHDGQTLRRRSYRHDELAKVYRPTPSPDMHGVSLGSPVWDGQVTIELGFDIGIIPRGTFTDGDGV